MFNTDNTDSKNVLIVLLNNCKNHTFHCFSNSSPP